MPTTKKTPVTKTPVVKTPLSNSPATKTAAAKPVDTKTPVAKTAVTKTPEVLEPVEAAVAASRETVDQVVKASTEAATKSVERVVEVTQEHVAAAAKAGSDVFNAYDDVIAFGKENFDAVMEANSVFSTGLQNLNEEIFAIFQSSFEDNTNATQKIFACTTVQDVVALQNDLVQDSYTKAMDQTKKITDLSVKVTEESTAPLTTRVNVTVEKFAKPLAA